MELNFLTLNDMITFFVISLVNKHYLLSSLYYDRIWKWWFFFSFFSIIYFLKKIGVTFCQFPFPIYYFNNRKFLHVSTKFFLFPVALYRSEKTSKTLTRETGNVEDNRAKDNGTVEVGEGELEAAFCSSDNCREVIEDLETNKTLNEEIYWTEIQSWIKRIPLKATSWWIGIVHQKKMMH